MAFADITYDQSNGELWIERKHKFIHICGMTALAKSRPKTAKVAKGKSTYRGVTLHGSQTRSRFTVAEIRRAVKNAIAKNPQAFAKRS